ncbi:MoaD/ThiS family protein [Limisalsivibrio acetivorans]|uniref:MoaD/ThiS family protein n=1 Tax=Limisalsivibrio acetivorans TaxID=1304888 RepID=UPI0003B3BAF0|nr:MoaD/ThiS family protein [Limisalsivibrio acetivorans]
MVTVEYSDGKRSETKPGTVKNILTGLGLRDNSTLVVREGELITHDIHVKSGETIKIVNVVSGG